MPNVYKALVVNQVPDLVGINLAPGKIIMQQVPVHARTVDNLYSEFCNYFHMPGHWTWDGGPTTPTPEQILDGDRKLGQCLALAKAFRMLALATPPHGLGLHAAQVGDPYAHGQYKGRYQRGFISTHPVFPNTILGLAANVFDTTNVNLALCGRSFYSWGDHKVVPYAGRLYDVSYRQIWNAMPTMARYHTIKDLDILAATYTVADDASGQRCYFRQLTMAECGTHNVRMGSLQGPYAGPNLPDGRSLMSITT